MKLLEALNIVKAMNLRKGRTLPFYLASGFTPLHLKTFLRAELSQFFPDRTIEASEGLFGDLLGNLSRFSKSDFEFGAVFLEWSDLDPRLGIRCTTRWNSAELDDILTTAQTRALRLQQQIDENSRSASVAVSLPTLPLIPFSSAPGWQASSFELDLRGIVQSFGYAISRNPSVRVVSSQSIDMKSPLRDRFDVEAEPLTGFPYRLPHASVLALSVAHLLSPRVPKKGLITDLDDTLWKGILGEDGIDGISWDLEHDSQMHAFYQRFLGSLASAGVMIGVASKNDPGLVNEALKHEDLALSPSVLNPVEAHWKPKSQSVARILQTWNVSADSIVFVDDSALELAEVEMAQPGVQCLQFPAGDHVGIYNLVLRLRDIFGKGAIFPEDIIRGSSIRLSHPNNDSRPVLSADDFLDYAKAVTTFDFNKLPLDPRALELVNKTNQFNMNGRRHTESSWLKLISESSAYLMVTSYRDKFGPLGKIAVIAGLVRGKTLSISTWAMSCRAFSRRIEYKCLAELISRFGPKEIVFDYCPTERNGPFSDFLSEIFGSAPSTNCTVPREVLQRHLELLLKLPESVNG